MVLSLGTPGHCPGFIMKLFQSITLSRSVFLNPHNMLVCPILESAAVFTHSDQLSSEECDLLNLKTGLVSKRSDPTKYYNGTVNIQ